MASHAHVGSRRARSRSPINSDVGVRDRGGYKDNMNNQMNIAQINPMMMNNMYQQGNMMIPGMFPNMMMPQQMMGGMMQPTMDMMNNTGMDIITPQSMDMSPLGNQNMAQNGPPVDMNMMGGMMMDPSVMGMNNIGMFNMPADMPPMPEKKEIKLKYCKLSPPSPGAAEPPKRAKPLGCRTIFVGGLPEKIRESIVREIFEQYGRIHTLRLSKKNFCHIRFDRESSVEAAMILSGYFIKIFDKDSDGDKEEDENSSNSGWLHVDYALSRDDQFEYERRQRQALRVQQAHMQQMNADQDLMGDNNYNRRSQQRSPSPVKVQSFSTSVIGQIMEKIKSEDQFSMTLPTLLAWLERGECSKKNSNQFYSMIQATNSHIRRLYNEKMQAEEELQETKDKVKTRIERVITQLEQVAKVFNAATHKRVWDHFTKPQRKNIETWQKMTQDFNALKEEFIERFESEDDYPQQKANDKNDKNEEIQMLKVENDSLRFQLEAYKNEVDVIKSDAKAEMEKFKAQFIARQALQGAFDTQPPPPPRDDKPPPPPKDNKLAQPLPPMDETAIRLKETVDEGCGEGKLIGVMSAFLQVHPQGASLDYVVSYVRAMFPTVTQATIHHVLQKHKDAFQLTTKGVGANMETRWQFVAFNQ